MTRKTTTISISIDAELLRKARALKLNISQSAVSGIEKAVSICEHILEREAAVDNYDGADIPQEDAEYVSAMRH